MGILQSCLQSCLQSNPEASSTHESTHESTHKSTHNTHDLSSLRKQASIHYKKRGSLLSASQLAYKSGDKKRAHQLSIAGKKEGKLGEDFDNKAATLVLHGQRWKEQGVIDLHGLHVKEAEKAVLNFIHYHLKENNLYKEILIITGAGHHSIHHDHPVIRPSIETLLTKHSVKWKEVHKRGALLCVGGGKKALAVEVGDGHFDKHKMRHKDNRI